MPDPKTLIGKKLKEGPRTMPNPRFEGPIPKGPRKIPNPRHQGPLPKGPRRVKPALGKYDSAKMKASKKIAPSFTGMFWLKSIDPRIELKQFSKSVVAKMEAEES